MKIKKYELEFGRLKKRRTTERIIVHHSAGADVPVTEIHRWHLNQGWSGVGYHFLIRGDGTVEEGRPLDTIGAHAEPQGNEDSIGVCLAGNFMHTRPAAAQIDALVLLIKYLRKFYGRELIVIGHKDVIATACPGSCFPWDELYSRLKGEEADTLANESLPEKEAWKQKVMAQACQEGLITAEHQPDDPAPKWFVLAVVLNLLTRMEVAGHED
ncbi:MAG: N-acetylmuramoyl-L-alanine amidase [Syntrophomonadaceae bacterium]|jgi:N-acetyl-anhydromuramyl-L-alanine amidase AmpD